MAEVEITERDVKAALHLLDLLVKETKLLTLKPEPVAQNNIGYYADRIRSALAPATPMQNLHDAPVEVKRYRLDINRTPLLSTSPDGNWVRYDDHTSALIAERARAEKAERERDEWRSAALEAREGCNMRSSTITVLRSKLEAAEARAEKATAERAEWEHWATTWHRTVKTMMTIIGLSSSLGAAEVLSEFRREMDLRGAREARLREALVEAIGVLERMADRADAIGERGYIADHLRRGANDLRARLSETSP